MNFEGTQCSGLVHSSRLVQTLLEMKKQAMVVLSARVMVIEGIL